jgi:hypothetical protein
MGFAIRKAMATKKKKKKQNSYQELARPKLS